MVPERPPIIIMLNSEQIISSQTELVCVRVGAPLFVGRGERGRHHFAGGHRHGSLAPCKWGNSRALRNWGEKYYRKADASMDTLV